MLIPKKSHSINALVRPKTGKSVFWGEPACWRMYQLKLVFLLGSQIDFVRSYALYVFWGVRQKLLLHTIVSRCRVSGSSPRGWFLISLPDILSQGVDSVSSSLLLLLCAVSSVVVHLSGLTKDDVASGKELVVKCTNWNATTNSGPVCGEHIRKQHDVK